MSKNLRFWEVGFVITCLTLYSGAIVGLILTNGFSEGAVDSGGGDLGDFSLFNKIFLLTDVVVIYLLSLEWKQAVYICIRNKYMLLFTLLVIASSLWSASPDMTSTRSLSLLGTNLFGLYFATRYSIKQQVAIFVYTFMVIVFLSLLFIGGLPKYGIMGGVHAGAWRGVFTHKNFLGRMMVMCIPLFVLHLMDNNDSFKLKISIYLSLFFGLVLLIMSKSTSSLIDLFTIFSAFVVFRTWRLRYISMIPTTLLVGFLVSGFYIWFKENSQAIFLSLDKDPSLSGRTDLWAMLIDIGARKLWLGYGYGAFWTGFDGPSAEVWYAIDWHPPHAHNGFIDLFLTLGLVGLALLFISLLDNFYAGFIYLRFVSKTPEAFWPLIYPVFMILSNTTESALMVSNDIYAVTYFSISYSLTKALVESKIRLTLDKDLDLSRNLTEI